MAEIMNMEICIIDDSEEMRVVTSKACSLIMPQIPVRIFEGVDSAIAYLKENLGKQRLLFLDLDMPDKNGWDFLNAYAPEQDDRIYILSASSDDNSKERAKRHHAVTGFVEKPLTLDKMRSISEYIEHYFTGQQTVRVSAR